MAKIIEMPKLGFDMAEGTLMNWLKAEGELIEKGEVLAEIETDKATVQVESSASGIIYKQLVPANTTLPIGTPIAVITDAGETLDLESLLGKQTRAAAESAQTGTTPVNEPEIAIEEKIPAPASMVKASPVAKAMARAQGLDLSALNGSGPGGRIVKRDVEEALKTGSAPRPTAAGAASAPGRDEVIPLSKLRSAIGRRMLESKRSIPAFYVTRSFDVAGLVEMRRQMNSDRDAEHKISFNDYVVRAIALALRQYPNLNASLVEQGMLHHGEINIGNAVALEGGLLTVVVRNADRKSIQQISGESSQLIHRAREGKLRNEDVEGSTFTISNLGMYGVEDFIAIINPPEAAILAVGSAQEVPVVENGELKTGWRMKATLSADHRISDGAEAAQFMAQLALFLEQPWRLLLT